MESLEKNEIPFENERLTPSQKTNEYIMTALRTKEGLDMDRVEGSRFRVSAQKFIDSGKLILKENRLILTREGKLFADGIAAEFFLDSINKT